MVPLPRRADRASGYWLYWHQSPLSPHLVVSARGDLALQTEDARSEGRRRHDVNNHCPGRSGRQSGSTFIAAVGSQSGSDHGVSLTPLGGYIFRWQQYCVGFVGGRLAARLRPTLSAPPLQQLFTCSD